MRPDGDRHPSGNRKDVRPSHPRLAGAILMVTVVVVLIALAYLSI